MTDKMKGFAMMAAMMSMASTSASTGNILTNDEIVERSKQQPKKVIPKGCKEYFFFESGNFVNARPNNSYRISFECVATSDKSAIKKYEKFVSKT